jgi:serine/threonine protein kinase
MTKPDWQQVKDIFADAVEQPLDSRLKFLRGKCDGDDLLFDEVSSLLSASSEPENLIENNAIDLASKVAVKETDYTEQHFGNYRILREIGSGGMGSVFLATRDDGEFAMQVALKIVRQSIADRDVIMRFKRERQILANLNHPNIAVLHDGGVSEKGEPYLAMEYVDGETLIEYADSHHLTVPEKLRLFLRICSAVAYAHRNLVVHRDIKPSNILVTSDGEPKLLDFGLAKAFESDESKTQTALRAFTPAYASPEQIQGGNITTASDIYSLGVVLYELLTGSKPLQLENMTFENILQTINTSRPVAPSSVPDRNDEATPHRLLRGDLDNIALTALRKEPERRYHSVEDLAEDIQDHLAGRTIKARPSTFGYRAGKFISRHKIAFAAGSIVLISLIAALVVSLWQASVARRESATSYAVNQFMQKMLLTAIPESGGGGKKGAQATIVDILDEAEKRLDGDELASQPVVRAELRQLIGEAYFTQGMYDAAGRNLKRAVDEQSELFGRDSAHTLKAEYSLASLYLETADYEPAYEIYERRSASWRSEFQLKQIEPQTYVSKLSDFAVACRAGGDSERAEQLLREALDVATQYSIDSKVDVTRTLLTLLLLDQGRFDEAKTSQLATVARVRQAAIPDDPSLPPALTLMGSILMENGDLADAQTDLVEAEGLYRKLYGPENLATYDNLRLQAQVAYLLGNYAAAAKKIDTVLEHYRKDSNPKYISFATALTVKGQIMNKLGSPREAETHLREALRLRTENLPPDHFMTALTKGALGEVLLDEKRSTEAEPLLRESLDSLRRSQKTQNARVTLAMTRVDRLASSSSLGARP